MDVRPRFYERPQQVMEKLYRKRGRTRSMHPRDSKLAPFQGSLGH